MKLYSSNRMHTLIFGKLSINNEIILLEKN